MFASVTTLVVVTRDRVVRAEFRARSARPTSIIVRERPETDDPVAAVVAGLGGERRAPGRVFVLSSDVWTRTLRVPALNLKNLSAAELQQSLAFEAEPLSGLSPAEAATAVLTLGEAHGLGDAWVGQISVAVLGEIDEVVRGAGGKLAGVLHPAGVPIPIDFGSGSDSGLRVEFWADATARVVNDGDRLTNLQIEQGAATANREAIVGEWARQSNVGLERVDVLVPDFRPSIDGEHTFADDATLETWLTAWHKVLTARKPAAPSIAPPPRPLSTQQRRNIAAVLAGVALLACIGHGYWVRTGIELAQAEQNRVEAPGRELASIKKQQGETEKALTKLRDETTKRAAEVKQAEETLIAHRRRLGALLDRLGRESTHQWVLRRIDGSPRELILVGLTMHPEHISALAADLAADLDKLGWTVEPPTHTARNQLNDGGPWSFELRLRDETLPKPATGSAPTAPAGPPNLVRVPME